MSARERIGSARLYLVCGARPRAFLDAALRGGVDVIQLRDKALGEQALIPESARPGTFPARLWARWRPYVREEPGPLLSGAVLLIRRAFWSEVGPMDERYFLYWEEMDWQLRARALGARSVLVPSARVVHHRSSSSGLTDAAKAEMMARSACKFLQRWMPAWKYPFSLLVLTSGQLARLVIWSLPPFRHRSHAPSRREAHSAFLVALARSSRGGLQTANKGK
jgi:GT2 family glycosyltransferase